MADMQGVAAMVAAMREIVDRVRAVTPDALAQAGYLVEGHAKILLTTTSHAKGTKTPSEPGEPPSLITGTLRRSITVEGPVTDGDSWRVSIGPTIVYGRIQELGGICGFQHRTHLPPRPYMAPALRRASSDFHSIMHEAWSAAMQR